MWIDAGDESARAQGKFIIEQEGNVNEVDKNGVEQAGAAVYLRAQPIELHQTQVANLMAMCAADQLAASAQIGYWQRGFRLQRAAIADRLTVEGGDSTLSSARDKAQKFAQDLLAWDRANESSAGAAPAADPCWDSNPLGYVRQEFAADLDANSRPLFD